MTQLSGVTCGLLVFSAMIVCGLTAGNPVEVIILRAVGGLFGGLMLGTLAGWLGTLVVRENVEVADGSPDADEARDQTGDVPEPS